MLKLEQIFKMSVRKCLENVLMVSSVLGTAFHMVGPNQHINIHSTDVCMIHEKEVLTHTDVYDPTFKLI